MQQGSILIEIDLQYNLLRSLDWIAVLRRYQDADFYLWAPIRSHKTKVGYETVYYDISMKL